jgi:hypothetical protein
MSRDLVIGIAPEEAQTNVMLDHYLGVYRTLGMRTARFTFPGQGAEFLALVQGSAPEIAFIISYLGLASRMGVSATESEPIWDRMQIPLLAYYPDAHFFARMDAQSQHVMRSDYVRKCYPFEDLLTLTRRFDRDEVYSFRVSPAVHENPFGEDTPWPQREVLGVFAKNVWSPQGPAAHVEACAPLLREIFWDCVSVLSSRTFANLYDTVSARFEQAGIHFHPHKRELFYFMLKMVDLHVRDHMAIRMAKALSRFPVKLVGANWDFVDKGAARATFHDRVPVAELNRLCANSKRVFNTNTTMQNWFHERVVLGFLSNCNVVSFDNAYYRQHFAQYDTFVGLPHDDGFEAALEAAIADDADRPDSRRLARAAAREAYSPERHARELLAIATIDLTIPRGALATGLG